MYIQQDRGYRKIYVYERIYLYSGYAEERGRLSTQGQKLIGLL